MASIELYRRVVGGGAVAVQATALNPCLFEYVQQALVVLGFRNEWLQTAEQVLTNSGKTPARLPTW
jgi:hypothetical protein